MVRDPHVDTGPRCTWDGSTSTKVARLPRPRRKVVLDKTRRTNKNYVFDLESLQLLGRTPVGDPSLVGKTKLRVGSG